MITKQMAYILEHGTLVFKKIQSTHLFNDHPVDVRVEAQHQESRGDNCGKVEEDEVVVVHHLDEEALLVVLELRVVPTEERQEAHYRPSHPAHRYDDCKERCTRVYQRALNRSRCRGGASPDVI